MIPYILHVALLISVCLLFYKLLLQKETFYRLNRVVLIFCLALSFVLPLIHVPQQWALRESPKPAETTGQPVIAYQPVTTPAQNGDVKTAPVVAAAPIKAAPVIAKSAPAVTTQILPLLQRSVTWLFYLYWIGVAAFGLNLLLQVVVLLYQAYTKPFIRDGKFRIVELSGEKAPCSFGNNIFINPEKYDWDTYSQILLHEKIHIQQRHSFDIIVAELVLVLQWFNPFAWLYRTELENNLEFLTDESVLEHKEVERESYQMSLLKVSAPHLSLGITTNYNQSLLKKRIVMMNSKRSNIHIMWKYFFLAPLLGALACALNDPIAAYSHPLIKAKIKAKNSYNHWSNSTDTAGSWFATIKGEKVKFEFRSDMDDHNWSSNSDFKLSEFSTLPKNQNGDFTLTRDAGTIKFNGKFDGNQGYGHYKYTPNKAFKAFLAQHGITELEDGDDFAFFMLNIDKDYLAMVENNGYKGLSKNDLISMAALKVDAPYISMWKELGFDHLEANQLVSGKALGINREYVSEIRKAGYSNLTFEQLVSFKATGITGKYISSLHTTNAKIAKPGKSADEKMPAEDVISVKALNVDGSYINGLAKEGYSDIPLNELTSMKAVGVTPQYIEELKSAGYKNIPPNELTSLKSLGVSPAYVKSLNDIGYKNIPVNQLVSMKSVGVTPEYVASLKSSGYTNISPNQLVSMKSVGITPDFAKQFVSIGYKNIPANELVSMKSVGVTPEFASSFQAAGYKNISANNLVSLRSMGITPDFAKSYETVGYKNIPYNELTSLKALDITPEYIKGFQDVGYKDVSINSYSSLKSLGVTPDFIEGFKKLGYSNITLNEATSLKATGVTPEYVSQMRDKGFKSNDIQKYIELKNAFN